MSKLIVNRSEYRNDEVIHIGDEWDGDYDAQLHNNGCLIIVEYVPNLDPNAQNEKKPKLVAMFNNGEWESVMVEE